MMKMKRFLSFSICFILVLSMFIYRDGDVKASDLSSSGRATINKSIEWEDLDQGIAKVSLNVETAGGVYEYDEVEPTNIVLVLDGSISMKDQEGKLENMQTAAKNFAKEMLEKAPSGKVKIAIVGFNGGIKVELGFTNDMSEIEKAIKKVTAEGSTNIQAGIKKAEDLFASVENCKKYMVLLSDGAPNSSYAVTKANFQINGQEDNCVPQDNGNIKHGVKLDYTYTIESVDYSKPINGRDWKYKLDNPYHETVNLTCSHGNKIKVNMTLPNNHGVATQYEADLAKAAGITCYTIAYDMTEDYPYPGKAILDYIATDKSKSFDSEMSKQDIDNVFASIQQSITKEIATGKNARVISKSNDLFVEHADGDREDVSYTVLPDTLVPSIGKASVAPNSNEVTWDIGDLPHDKSIFTLTYKVKIDLAAIHKENVIHSDASTLNYDKYNETGNDTVRSAVDSNKPALEYYRVVFVNGDEKQTVLKIQYVLKNNDATAPEDPSIENTAQYIYSFDGWDGNYTNVTKDERVVATYTTELVKYKVTFVDDNGTTVLGTDLVNYGEAATYRGETPAKAYDGHYSYKFSGWDKDYSYITSDLTVTAGYTPIVNIAEPTAPASDVKPKEDNTKKDNTKKDTTKKEIKPTKQPSIDIPDEDTPAGSEKLPDTGTISVDLFYMAGGVLILMGVSVLLVKKTKHA